MKTAASSRLPQCVGGLSLHAEWEQLTERLGFWIHLDEAYVTFHQSYVESVWWALKTLFDRGLLYQGHKIVWWWAQGGTALSPGEVGQGYREVADERIRAISSWSTATRQIIGHRCRYALVWTTTPWTLPSNQFAAVKPDSGILRRPQRGRRPRRTSSLWINRVGQKCSLSKPTSTA
jgi:isoleucyl-tRNA synthetase